MSEVTLHTTDAPSDDDQAGMLEVLRTFTRARVPTLDNHDYALLLKDDAGELLGGLIAQSRWGSFYIDILALSDALRGRGWGSPHLIEKAESEARRRACHHMRLDTYAFQAKAFYERHGFAVYGQIEGPEPYYPHYFMMKPL